ncbi:MAG TPA: cupin domain-containing protein [Candidatus Woesebacteria bacterium]|jgi:quercetin dioxygenase-like cupin family protein|nr:cupin domain-containing protein [Candidatus Shapirobacteria bacterium]HOR01898.1 cupin domain-containing protein [Candidatus Woesebacteria bacterium]
MKTLKFKNGKYFHGKYENNEKTRGWFIGSFFEKGNNCKTSKLEIMYRIHKKGDIIEAHYHKKKVELLIMIEGSAKYTINDEDIFLEKGDFLFIDVNNLISGEFTKSSKIFAIHSPSIPTDKFKLQ